MYSHYTVAFPLAAQALWALWSHGAQRRPVLLANAGAALLFVPWIPGFIDDQNSPTTQILSILSPIDPHTLRLAIEAWAVGFPYVSVHALPGALAAIAIGAGIVVAAGAGIHRLWGTIAALNIRRELVLVAVLALATPVGELVFSVFSANVFGARNLNSAWPGFALAIGAILAAAPGLVAVTAALFVLAGYAWGAAKTLKPEYSRPDYPQAAQIIQANLRPGDRRSTVACSRPCR